MAPDHPVSLPSDIAQERRLHPLSWLFVLLTQLRSLVFPIIAFVFLGKGDSWVFAGLIGAVAFSLYALVYSLGFRYRIGPDELVVRSGIFSRTERHVLYERIQNIVQKRNPLHRLFGVTELRLESAGGSGPEAVMNVITVDAARELERVLRDRGDSDADAADSDNASQADVASWHQVGNADLLRLGLLNDRGWVAIGALVAVYWQFGENNWNPMRELYRHAGEWFGVWSHAFASATTKTLSVVAVGLVIWLAVKLLSMVMAIVTFHRFRLSGDAQRLSTEAGLLTRHVASARRDKIQRLIIGESWWARKLGRRWLSCEVAVGASAEPNADQKTMRLRWLAPIGTQAQIADIAARVLPGLRLDRLEWQPLHPRARRRYFNAQMYALVLMIVVALALIGPWVLLAVPPLTTIAWLRARGWAQFAAYACDDDFIAYRAGWLHRRWTVARTEKGQTLSLTHSPFDRRHGMQTLSLDTAGASVTGLALSIPYLPIDDARAVAELLRPRMATEPT